MNKKHRMTNRAAVAFLLQGIGLVAALGGYCWLLGMREGAYAFPAIGIIIGGGVTSFVAAIVFAYMIASQSPRDDEARHTNTHRGGSPA